MAAISRPHLSSSFYQDPCMGGLEHHSAPLRESCHHIFTAEQLQHDERNGCLNISSISAPFCLEKESIAKAQQADKYCVKRLLALQLSVF